MEAFKGVRCFWRMGEITRIHSTPLDISHETEDILNGLRHV